MSITITLFDLLPQLSLVEKCLMCLGRLHWLLSLSQPQLAKKRSEAKVAAQFVEAAYRIDEFQQRQFQAKETVVAWPIACKRDLDCVLTDGHVDRKLLSELTVRFGQHTRHHVERLIAHLESSTHFEPAYYLIKEFEPLLFCFDPIAEASYADMSSDTKGVWRSLHGPVSIAVDPVFSQDYSLCDRNTPPFDDTLSNSVEYFWCLALREAAASDWCALNGFEYDGLPLRFYRDMAKQTWDESRHAVMFLDCAVQMFSAVQSELPPDHPLQHIVCQYRSIGSGLSVPLEIGLYESLWNAELHERLILLQIETEGKAVASFKRRQQCLLAQRFPFLLEALRIDEYDEISHASFGNKWLRFLIPDAVERAKAIDTAGLLRGIFLLISFSHKNNKPLGELITEVSTGRRFPTSGYLTCT
jgi:hypothetical protein